ncbi:LacI family DNA-binding transcriptional regulator [Streptomyces albus subsp. chlorinus]|uniref:LacI family DNA-binding transcriptional regulator n=1 Tax=Streptomyces albus TaxID=1888 RepID=UPI00156E59B8
MTTHRSQRPATIPDVAREAGVSRSTASRALADYGSVSPRTRERVRAAATKLGYRPNQLARSMITGRTHTLGVVVADIQNPFFAGVTRGIADTARAAGYQVLLANTDEDLAQERSAVKMLRDKHVDGVIIAPASPSSTAHLAALREARCPLVLLDREVPSLGADTVTVDNRGAAEDAVRRLLEAGHRRIGLVTLGGSGVHVSGPAGRHKDTGGHGTDGSGADGSGTDGSGSGDDRDERSPRVSGPGGDRRRAEPPGQVSTGVERVRGFRAALHAAGLDDPDTYVRVGVHGQDPAVLAAGLLGLPQPPTALFTTDSLIALGALSAIQEAGLRVPEDISLVTFDDADWTSVIRPRLSVVAQPVQELGARAVRALLARIEGHAEVRPEHIVLDTAFVPRESIAPPPSR